MDEKTFEQEDAEVIALVRSNKTRKVDLSGTKKIEVKVNG